MESNLVEFYTEFTGKREDFSIWAVFSLVCACLKPDSDSRRDRKGH